MPARLPASPCCWQAAAARSLIVRHRRRYLGDTKALKQPKNIRTTTSSAGSLSRLSACRHPARAQDARQQIRQNQQSSPSVCIVIESKTRPSSFRRRRQHRRPGRRAPRRTAKMNSDELPNEAELASYKDRGRGDGEPQLMG
jgi:hypothetical protein